MFPGAANAASYDFDLSLHSLTPSVDGKTTYLAYLRGGFGILDTSEVAADTDRHFISLNDTLLTPVDRFVRWGAGNHCAGHTPEGYSESHSAVPLPGRPFALTVDEVYGTLAAPSFGCPWGWIRLIMWSFPIVKDGLIYVMGVRNGVRPPLQRPSFRRGLGPGLPRRQLESRRCSSTSEERRAVETDGAGAVVTVPAPQLGG